MAQLAFRKETCDLHGFSLFNDTVRFIPRDGREGPQFISQMIQRIKPCKTESDDGQMLNPIASEEDTL